jgi:hypothetical protein
MNEIFTSREINLWVLSLVRWFVFHLQSTFFPAKFFFSNLEKGILAGKKLLCKEGYSNLKFKICQAKITN